MHASQHILSYPAYVAKLRQTPPLVKRLRTPSTPNGRPYIYDTGTNKILLLDSPLDESASADGPAGDPKHGDLLVPAGGWQNDGLLAELYDAYRSFGAFDPVRYDVVTFSEAEIDRVRHVLRQSGPDLLILNATEACNLRCRYCSFSGAYPHNRRHGTRSMTLAMAKKAADWYLSFDRPKYGFAFYGGEPLLVRDRIAQLLQYIKQQTDRPVSVNMTTNGTLLDAAFVDWCVAHDVVLTISLDGPQTVHDRYRVTAGNDGTFSTVFQRVRWLQENYPEWYRDHVLFNMVVAPPFRFAEIHAFITENAALFSRGKLQIAPLAGDPSAVHAALGIPSVPTADDRAEMGRAMCHFDADLRRAGGSGPFLHALIGDGLLAIHKRDSRKLGARTPSHGQCIPGQRKCFVDTDGQLYMCEKVQNRAIGRIGAGLDEDEIAAFLRDYSTFLGEHCRNCWAIRLCQKCFNSIRDGDRLSEARLGDVCRGMRRGLVDKLTRYCAIREQTDEAFRWADDVELQ